MKKLLILSLVLLVGSCSKSSRTPLAENEKPVYAQGYTARTSSITADCYASPTGVDTNTGASISLAKQHIQTCINAVSSGQTVIAEQGTYVENINFNGKNITVASEFINSGLASDITGTTIDGNHAGPAVTMTNGENNNAKLIGVTIQNGYASDMNSTGKGGGIWCYNSTPTINNLRIIRNSAENHGGGISASSATSTQPIILENLDIENNNGGAMGGGISLNDINASINNIKLINNFTPYGQTEGGGLYLNGVTIVGDLEKLYVYGNAASFGGGIYVANIVPNTITNIKNVVIANNTTMYAKGQSDDCGAMIGAAGIDIHIDSSFNSTVNIINSTISTNKTQGAFTTGGLGVTIDSSNTSSFVNAVNSIFWGNTSCWQGFYTEYLNQILVNFGWGGLTNSTLRASYNNIEGSQTEVFSYSFNGATPMPYPFTTSTWLAGNINSDPLFINPVPILTPQGSENYSISPSSPCVDTGTNAISIGGQSITIPVDDIIGTARPQNSIVDMGAYEIVQRSATGQPGTQLTAQPGVIPRSGIPSNGTVIHLHH